MNAYFYDIPSLGISAAIVRADNEREARAAVRELLGLKRLPSDFLIY